MWALASPVGSSPDDNFHLPSIWCGLGDRDGLCEAAPDAVDGARQVPASLITASCYAFAPEQSGDCWNPQDDEMHVVERLNTQRLYPPLFYAAMSVFAGPDVEASVMAMRIANSVLFVGFLTAVFCALPRRLRPPLVISALATIVPLGLFIIPSTNPTSWTLLSTATVWVTFLGGLQSTGRQRLVLFGLSAVATLLGAGARADAAAFAVFGVIVACVLGLRRRDRSLILTAAAALIVVVISIGFYLSSGQSGAVVSGLAPDQVPLTFAQHLKNLLEIPTLWVGALGGWGLGWLDTLMPGSVTVLATAVFFGVIAIGIHRLDGRKTTALVLAVGAAWGVPFVLLAQSNAVVGTQVQPRYILPLLVILIGVAVVGTDATRTWRGARLLVSGIALTAAMGLALHTNIRRYTTGVDDQALDPGERAEWWWTVAPSPLATLLIAVIAFAGVFVVLELALRSPARQSAVQAEESNTPSQAAGEASLGAAAP
nr:DUF2142 domain-containing protein [Microbacterium pseudoresistens]